MVDQLAAQWLPSYGHRVVQAPHLQALAARAVSFDAAYCSSPLCAPSRSAMLAGRHASHIGVYDNAAELPASVPTLAHHLRLRGYHTALAGKMHFVGPDQLHGFERRLTTDVYPASLDWTPDWRTPAGQRLPWYHSMESVLTPGRCAASMQTDYDDEVAFHAVRHIYDLARNAADEPFLLVVSFTNPHDPWELPPRYWDRYDPDAIPLPTVPDIPIEQSDPHSRRLRAMSQIDEVEVSEEQIRRARHGYFAAISYVDERIGMVLDALRAAGLHDSTTVAFTADHGEFLGERGLWYKMSLLDPSARIPLMIAPAGAGAAEGRRVATPVSHLDLVPTLLELAGGADVDAAGDFDGVSLAGLVRDGDGERGPVVAEYLAEGVNAPVAMIREGRHKLIVCEDDPDLLYDLQDDPLELENLTGRPEHEATVEGLRKTLAAQVDLGAVKQRVLASQRERHLVAAALARGEVTPWDFQPHVDASMQYVRTRADLYDIQRRARLDAAADPPRPAGP